MILHLSDTQIMYCDRYMTFNNFYINLLIRDIQLTEHNFYLLELDQENIELFREKEKIIAKICTDLIFVSSLINKNNKTYLKCKINKVSLIDKYINIKCKIIFNKIEHKRFYDFSSRFEYHEIIDVIFMSNISDKIEDKMITFDI